MKLQRIPALAILAVSAASPLHAQRETDKRPTHGDQPGSQLLDESFANLEKAANQARRVATEAIRQRDMALRALEEEKRSSAALRKRVEERMKRPEGDRRPGADAAQHDRKDSPRRDVRPPIADFREDVAAARKELSALREELGKLRESQHPKDGTAELKKRLAQLEAEKKRLEEISKTLGSKLEAEMKTRRALTEKLSATAATERKLAETEQKLENANKALTVQLKAISDARKEAQKANLQREAMEQLFKRNEAELKKQRQDVERRRDQNKDGKRAE